MGWDKHDMSLDGSERMDSTITHFLDKMGQVRYIVGRQWKDGCDDHSLPRWDGTSTTHRETAVKGWMR